MLMGSSSRPGPQLASPKDLGPGGEVEAFSYLWNTQRTCLMPPTLLPTKPLDQQDMVKGTGQGSSTLRYLWAWPLLLATGEHKASSARKEVSAEVGPAYHP